jgi:hypothetical protein
MKLAHALSIAAALATLAATASAEVHELKPVPIVVKPARPLVTEIAKPAAAIDAAKVKAPVLPKIAEAVSSGPF